MTEKERKRDVYLKWKYGRGLKWYRRVDKEQHHKCAICRRPPKNLPLAVDHAHWVEKLKVVSFKRGGYWQARVEEFLDIRKKNKVRKKAIKSVKRELLKRSTRGLLCWACNTGLRKWHDKPINLLRAAKYLRSYESTVGLRKPCPKRTK